MIIERFLFTTKTFFIQTIILINKVVINIILLSKSKTKKKIIQLSFSSFSLHLDILDLYQNNDRRIIQTDQ